MLLVKSGGHGQADAIHVLLRMMKTGLTPEPARTGDLAAVQSLLRQAALPFEDLTVEHLRHFVLVRDAGTVIGVVGLERFGNDGLLRSLVVRPADRRGGLGRSLVIALEGSAQSDGVEDIYLLTLSAQKFFAGCGYELIARDCVPEAIQTSTEFASLCPGSAICLHRRLT